MSKANPAPGDLTDAIQNFDFDLAEDLLRNGANPNERVSGSGDDGETALHLAIMYGDFLLARMLVEKGADLEAVNNDGQTPLIIAASNDDIPVLKLLIDKGAALDTKDNEGWTALQWSHDEGRRILTEAVQLRQQQAEAQAVEIERKKAEAEQKRIADQHNTALARQEVLRKGAGKSILRPRPCK